MNIEKLAKSLNVDEKKAQSIAFWVIEFLLDNISDDVIDCGSYHNSPMNGDANMVESYKAMLSAQCEEIHGNKPELDGFWTTVDPINGIEIHKERPYK